MPEYEHEVIYNCYLMEDTECQVYWDHQEFGPGDAKEAALAAMGRVKEGASVCMTFAWGRKNGFEYVGCGFPHHKNGSESFPDVIKLTLTALHALYPHVARRIAPAAPKPSLN